jgi:hypothetical protein
MFCTITPTRGDRPELLEFCKHQLQRMNIKPAHSYFIDDKPSSGHVDLVTRVKKGINQAINDGFENIYIIEDDDYYSPFYFSKLRLRLDGPSFIGIPHTLYYHIGLRQYKGITHPGRSSLFTTAFKSHVLENFHWPDDTNPFLDLKLWEHAKKHKRMFTTEYIDSSLMFPAIGIKHGIGLCGGSGHNRMKYQNDDPDLEFLKRHVDSDAFYFYQRLMKKF